MPPLVIAAKDVPIGRIFRNPPGAKFFVKWAYDGKAGKGLAQDCDTGEYWEFDGDRFVVVLSGDELPVEEECRRLGLVHTGSLLPEEVEVEIRRRGFQLFL